MSWVIHLKRSGRPDAWHTDHGETEVESEAVAYATEEQAKSMADMCGLYRDLRFGISVRRSKIPVNRPGPGSDFSFTAPTSARMSAAKGGANAIRPDADPGLARGAVSAGAGTSPGEPASDGPQGLRILDTRAPAKRSRRDRKPRRSDQLNLFNDGE